MHHSLTSSASGSAHKRAHVAAVGDVSQALLPCPHPHNQAILIAANIVRSPRLPVGVGAGELCI
jgi:hypothetical protein